MFQSTLERLISAPEFQPSQIPFEAKKHEVCYNILPSYTEQLINVQTTDALQVSTHHLMTQLASIVFPNHILTLKSILDPAESITITKQPLNSHENGFTSGFIDRVVQQSQQYGVKSYETLNLIRSHIKKHEERLSVINSQAFQFTSAANNVLDTMSVELTQRVKDTLDAFHRRV